MHLHFVLVTALAAIVGLTLPAACLGEDAAVIHHQGFADFSRGTFPDGGANIYVSKAGVIQLIPRWDLNGDGFIDLLINQDENEMETVDAFIYWGRKEGYQSLFPAFWRETMPAYKLVQAIEKRDKHVAFLPTFGGGPVKIIDLNGDGFLDIIFPNLIHNYTVHMEAYIYWGGPDGHSPQRMTKLPTLFGRELDVADFNRDGRLDVVVANYGNETGDRWGYKNHRESYIYWGRAEGFSSEHRTSIPTLSAVSCASGDFNGDDWPDVAFANNNLRDKSLTVYLGSEDGIRVERRLHVEGGEPMMIRAGDVNGDKIDDLLVRFKKGHVALHLGSADFDIKHAAADFPIDANDATLGDFNGDGHIDVAFATMAAADIADQPGATLSEVYWGSAAGFDPARKQALPTLSPKAVASADLNNDGFAELLFANYTNGKTHDVPSYIYWGSAHGYEAANRTNLMGFGPVGIAAADLDRNDIPDIVLMNQNSGSVDGEVPSVIFWGNSAHNYSEAAATLLAAKGPYGSKIADLNDDGYSDVVFTGESPCIHWGSAEGFKTVDWFTFDERMLGVTVGDYNRDGFLDLAFSNFGSDPRKANEVTLLWGSIEGFDESRSKTISLQAERSCCGLSSADLNNDGFLDLVLPAGESRNGITQILWGHADGFEATRPTLLKTDGVGAPAVADLNCDGWLEMILPGFQDLATQDPHCETLLYWGSPKGYDDDRRTELEAYTSGEIVVADLNGDGHLDLVSSNYKSNETRSLPIFIFWGNAAHEYSNDRRSELPAESSLGLQVLDLNDDDIFDIVVHNHIKDGDHTYGGYIYWGDKDGYSIKRRQHLPIVGPHYSVGLNPGNIFDRGPGSEYISPTVAVPRNKRTLILVWHGDTPHETEITFKVRAAATEAAMKKSDWMPLTPGEPLTLPADVKMLQYSAMLISPNGGSSPRLREVVLSFDDPVERISKTKGTAP